MSSFIQNMPEKNKRGFTLIEVMVSVSIFTIVVTIGIGSLLVVNKANAQSRADREATDKISYLMEHVTRKLQTAISIDPDSSESELKFINQLGDRETYSYNNGTGELLYTYEKCDPISSIPCSPPLSDETHVITPEDSLVSLDTVRFLVEGNALDDSLQPSVRIIMSGSARERQRMSPFSVQTIISPRILQFGNP